MAPKIDKKWSLGRSRHRFFYFYVFGRGPFFYAFLDRQKVGPKSNKCAKMAAKGGPAGDLGAARRNERGRRGGTIGGGQRTYPILMTAENHTMYLAKCDQRFKAE